MEKNEGCWADWFDGLGCALRQTSDNGLPLRPDPVGEYEIEQLENIVMSDLRLK